MHLQVVGCSHHNASIEVRERLAFSGEQTCAALEEFGRRFPEVESVLLSTCNRVEIYTATESGDAPSLNELAGFLAGFHGHCPREFLPHLYHHVDREAVRHLFTVASSLDSMVVGEPQILAQVKQAYQSAAGHESVGPLLHAAFQAALKVARRVACETRIHHHRVSIPSVAVADFAEQIFERFDDKRTLVIGAGEMAEETLQYLKDKGARDVTVVNRSDGRAVELAARWQGKAAPWERLDEAIVEADLVISTTGADEPIVTAERFAAIESARAGRPLFVLDLAVPRDFDPAVGERPEVYLYSVDDLRAACQRNRQARDKELPAAERIIEDETERFVAELRHRATGPVIQRLREEWHKPKEEELRRLWNKLPDLDDRAKEEIRQSFDRLVNKLLHPPLESLRDESRHGLPSTLLDAVAKLFRLKD
ncbi:MAG: glutamyl-tRNA reductase [Planctomycetia bacterium]|nr:glutamyl-tRNA reductase [Planctomycetia bacterium]